eukprot:14693818-Alexandrium_andersonii.AAC.1
MSASLVGSEMCIRDSAVPAPAAPARLLQACSRLSRAGTRARARAFGWCCLLYTSDAADDM